jgi:hypothetical protein
MALGPRQLWHAGGSAEVCPAPAEVWTAGADDPGWSVLSCPALAPVRSSLRTRATAKDTARDIRFPKPFGANAQARFPEPVRPVGCIGDTETAPLPVGLVRPVRPDFRGLRAPYARQGLSYFLQDGTP